MPARYECPEHCWRVRRWLRSDIDRSRIDRRRVPEIAPPPRDPTRRAARYVATPRRCEDHALGATVDTRADHGPTRERLHRACSPTQNHSENHYYREKLQYVPDAERRHRIPLHSGCRMRYEPISRRAAGPWVSSWRKTMGTVSAKPHRWRS